MSGPLGSSQWMYSSGFYPYEIEQSLRFNDDDSAYLSRTPASAGNRKTWTWSGWVKRGNVSTSQMLFDVRFGSPLTLTNFTFAADNSLYSVDFITGATNWGIKTIAAFRDPSAWYHVVYAFDSTQTTASDRIKIYVNGILQATEIAPTYPAQYPDLNEDANISSTNPHAIGATAAPSDYFDGYMAEVNFIDGTALDPTSFGEFKSGVWIPKKYTGSYGTNGFYLSFADSAAIGDDLSGNGNDWTPSGLASTDVLLDSPTNNYAVLNPLGRRRTVTTLPTFSEGNLRVVFPNVGGNATYAISSHAVSSGKYYYEVNVVTRTTELVIGVGGQTVLDEAAGMSGYQATTGTIGGFTSNDGPGASYTSGDLIGVALDLDAGTCAFYKNGVLQATGTGFPFSPAHPFVQGNTSDVIFANFGQSPFAYTPPAGFLALNTANLPEPTITPARDDVPADYFNTVLYTGNGTGQSITGVGFQPDLVWGKPRNQIRNHNLMDVVRGPSNVLISNTTGAELAGGELTSFDADGFTLGAAVYQMNQSGDTMVAWNWKAAGAGVANTDGTISSTVSANQKAGFSIVSYTGNATADATVGHGLANTPEFFVVKVRSVTAEWLIYHRATGKDGFMQLQSTAAFTASSNYWGTSGPSASTIQLNGGGGVNNSGSTYIAYCFAEVEGYSKFGSYTGNGSADGPFVWTSFRPAFVMVKRTDAADEWAMHDNSRPAYNPANLRLIANSSGAELSTQAIDLTSNGFKVRSSASSHNQSGGTYIFMAFSEMPFKYSGGR